MSALLRPAPTPHAARRTCLPPPHPHGTPQQQQKNASALPSPAPRFPAAGALGGPLEVLELLTPVMSVTVLVFSLAWERLWSVLPGSPYFESFQHSLITFIIILAGGTIAFLMVWTEYQV